MGARRPKDGSERPVRPPRSPLRSARIPPNPPNPGQNDPVPGQTSLQGPENPAVEAVRTPSPYLYPSGKPALACPRNTPEKAPSLDEDPLQPLNFNPVTRPPERRYGPPLLQGDRHAPESVIGLSELVIGIVGIRRLTRSNNFSRSMSTTTLYPSATYSDAFLNAWWARYVRAGSRSSTPKRSDPAAGPEPGYAWSSSLQFPPSGPLGSSFFVGCRDPGGNL